MSDAESQSQVAQAKREYVTDEISVSELEKNLEDAFQGQYSESEGGELPKALEYLWWAFIVGAVVFMVGFLLTILAALVMAVVGLV